MQKVSVSGGWLVFLGALFWSLNAPIVTFLTLDSFLLCGLRALIAGLALTPFIRFRQLKWNRWMLLYVCSYCLLCISVILALDLTDSAIAIGMQYTAAIWLFLAGLLKSRRFDLRSFIPVAVITVGVVFFMRSGTGASDSTGNLIALSEGITFALMTVSAKKAAGANPLGLTAVGNLFTGIVVLLSFPASTATLPSMTLQDWVLMLILGVVQIGCGYAFYNMGVLKTTPRKASVIALWEMILGPLWVALFLKDYPSLPVLIGFLIILTGMLLDAWLARDPA